jgi:hypothetical protein
MTQSASLFFYIREFPLLTGFTTLQMEMTHSSETLVFTRPTWHHISEDDILHGYFCENFKCCISRNYLLCISRTTYRTLLPESACLKWALTNNPTCIWCLGKMNQPHSSCVIVYLACNTTVWYQMTAMTPL